MPDIVCISPVDGREVVRRAASSAAEIEAAVAAARKAQAEWKRVVWRSAGKFSPRPSTPCWRCARRSPRARLADGSADPLRRR